jgi:hypothetical protein
VIRVAVAACALLGGALVYLTRPVDPVAVAWLDGFGLHGVAALFREARAMVHASVTLPSWLRGSASDFAWAFALGIVLGRAPPRVRALGLALALAHEVAQLLRLVPGTFDPIDLAVLFCAFLLGQILSADSSSIHLIHFNVAMRKQRPSS